MKRLILTLLSTAAAVTLAAQPDSLDYRGDYYFSKRSQQESLPVRPHHTVMLGNSLTERGAWAEYFPEAHVINRGIGGDCVAGMAARLDSIVAGRPRAIFLMAGVNDLIFSTIAPEALLRQYERLLDRYAASPQQRYEALTERCPDVLQLVPLRELASYLGVRPETLSRIRRRVR